MPAGDAKAILLAEWIRKAENDLAVAKELLERSEPHSLDAICSHAQQAAEKSLKAVYQHFAKRFRYTHDLDELINGLRNEGITIPLEVTEAALLSSYAWEARYPGLSEPVTKKEFREALRQAKRVVGWATEVIRG